jgi:hypothetical protein
VVREGAASLLPRLPEFEREALREGLAAAFGAAFLGAASLTAIGAFLAWRVPLRRL